MTLWLAAVSSSNELVVYDNSELRLRINNSGHRLGTAAQTRDFFGRLGITTAPANAVVEVFQLLPWAFVVAKPGVFTHAALQAAQVGALTHFTSAVKRSHVAQGALYCGHSSAVDAFTDGEFERLERLAVLRTPALGEKKVKRAPAAAGVKRAPAAASGGAAAATKEKRAARPQNLNKALLKIMEEPKKSHKASHILGKGEKHCPPTPSWRLFFTTQVSATDAPDYTYWVPEEKHMWLEKMMEKARSGRYTDSNAFMDDVRQIQENAVTYNTPGRGAHGGTRLITEANKLVKYMETRVKRMETA